MNNEVIILLSITFLALSKGANILALFPVRVRSHFKTVEPLLQELSVRGHHVKVFSSFPQEVPLQNYTDVVFQRLDYEFTLEAVKRHESNAFSATMYIHEIGMKACNIAREPAFQHLLRTRDKFDVIITVPFGSECMAYYGYKLQTPVISFVTFLIMPWMCESIGLPNNLACIPHSLQGSSSDFSLWERTYNTALNLFSNFWHFKISNRRTQKLMEEIFGEPLPPLEDVVANTSLVFLNSHHSLTSSKDLPPHVVEIGGIHIKEKQPLQEDIQTILDEGEDGVIFMSFGSLFKISSIPKSTISTFLKVFSKLRQTVLLKYDTDLPEAPSNVIVQKWFQQRDILEHENVVAFITHGGVGSIMEAVQFKVPILGIPQYGDQFCVMSNVVQRGVGVQLPFDLISENSLLAALTDLLENPRYKENVRQLSQQFQDRPQSALELAVYWTEYVIKHKGAPHLRPDSPRLPLYQYFLLDVIAVLVSALVVFFCIIRSIVKRLRKRDKNTFDNVVKKKN